MQRKINQRRRFGLITRRYVGGPHLPRRHFCKFPVAEFDEVRIRRIPACAEGIADGAADGVAYHSPSK